ncbi:hypothetical protein [Nonomuraea sp. SYSU D8015]|uniref:hypothetical protein n=1 Tax=Nonomuraea sp. SYSU D8015 TaxID=2593644 RepID=UPI0016604F0E|nr:hypothetical protein [Nonomuraea sp. SYSU D8015]
MEPISVDIHAVFGEVERQRNDALTESATLRAHVAALTGERDELRAELERLRRGEQPDRPVVAGSVED